MNPDRRLRARWKAVVPAWRRGLRDRRLHVRGAVLLAVLALGGVGVGGFGAGGVRSAAVVSAVAVPPEDTVVVFGPREFISERGRNSVYVEQVGLPLEPGTRYRVRVEPGSERLARAVVRLDGEELFRSRELVQAEGVLEREVVATGESMRLEVEVEGRPGAGLRLSIVAVSDPSFMVWGPMRWVRESGSPAEVEERFVLPAGATEPYLLHVRNGTVTGDGRVSGVSVLLNGMEVVGGADLSEAIGVVTRPVVLLGAAEGENVVVVRVRSRPGAELTLWIRAEDGAPPVLTLESPGEGLVTSALEQEIRGRAEDDTAVQVEVNGEAAAVANGEFTAMVPLPVEGLNTIRVVARDAAGNESELERTVVRDTQLPVLTVSSPADGLETDAAEVPVSGSATDASALSLAVNGVPVALGADGAFQTSAALAFGANTVVVVATDAAGNSASVARQVTRTGTPPPPDTEPPVLTLTSPAEGLVTTAEAVQVSGTVTDASPVTLTLNGASVVLDAGGGFSTSFALVLGGNALTLVATDAAGNEATVVRNVTRREPSDDDLPPDPALVAPALDPSVVTLMHAQTEFLYTGNDPIQRGVAPGTINPLRVAVVRGRVLDRAGAPLPGVRVTVHRHDELGWTLSREDGAFDMAVNGGGPLVIDYTKSEYLPVQRRVEAGWQEWAHAPDVVLIGLDPNVTVVDLATLTAPVVASGSVESDIDGQRQAHMLFKPGTTAEMVLPDGSTQPLTSLSVRATEYTVGERGPEMMPGELPLTVGYTYAVELSVDEALAAGATSVRFSQGVPSYVDNFRGFPVGTPVPAGYYDRASAQWIGAPNGRVIRVVSQTGGLADVDIDGDGAANTEAELAALGIDAAERGRLAELYAPGASLWRTPIDHFTPWDYNWPYGPPEDATDPRQRQADGGERESDDPCEQDGSIIECQNQVLGERIGITGTPFSLNYRSDRVPGTVRTIEIPVTGDSVPPSLEGVTATVEIAGRTITQRFDPLPNQSLAFEWDGMDAYGRPTHGTQFMTVVLSWEYPLLYFESPSSFEQSWARIDDTSRVVGNSQSMTFSARQVYTIPLRRLDFRGTGLAGWTLDAHHLYDPDGQRLYLGSGEQRNARGSGLVVVPPPDRFAGRFDNPEWIDVGPDGSVYVAADYGRVFRITPDGQRSRFAGAAFGSCRPTTGDPCIEDVPATEALFEGIQDIAVAADGNTYIADRHRILVVDREGMLRRVAGTGMRCSPFDPDPYVNCRLEGPALEVPFSNDLRGIATGPDGNAYIISSARQVARLGPDGMLQLIAGPRSLDEATISPDCAADGMPAVGACLNPYDVAVGPDGKVYVLDRTRIPDTFRSDWDRIFEIGSDGRLRLVFDDRLAPLPMLLIFRISVDGQGFLYASSAYRRSTTSQPPDREVIYRIDPATGESVMIAGRIAESNLDYTTYGGVGRPALATQFSTIWSAAPSPDGSVYLVEGYPNERVRRLEYSMPTFDVIENRIASADGGELYEFDPSGRHLRTLAALTGDTLYRFEYDPAGRLAAVTDIDGLVTTVERNATGAPTSIVGPYGHRTALSLNGEDRLAAVTNPAGETTRFGYGVEGLLASVTDPRGATSSYAFDNRNALIRAENRARQAQTLSRTRLGDLTEVTLATPLGRTTRYRVESGRDGTANLEVHFPDGTTSRRETRPDGTQTVALPDGRVIGTEQGPDPRFGMQAPVRTRQTVRTPGGLESTLMASRRVTLADPTDPLSLLQQIDSLRVNGRAYVTTFDATERQYTVVTPEGREMVVRIDSIGRLVEARVPGTSSTTFGYDENGRVVEARQDERVWRYAYDEAGRLASVTDPLARVERFAYDAAGRVTSKVLTDGREIALVYDAAGNLLSLSPPGRSEHDFVYDASGRLESYAPPELDGSRDPVRYLYDEDGQLSAIEQPDGTVVAVEYDAAGNLSSVALARGAVRFEYDPESGRLSRAEAPDGGTLALVHDGALLTETAWTGAVAGRVSVVYDDDFRVGSRTVEGGGTDEFAYDGDGLLTGAGALQIERHMPSGRAVGTVLGGVSTGLLHDGYGELVADSAIFGATPLLQTRYTRDLVGRITRRVETVQGVTTIYDYGYDVAGRLVEVRRDGAAIASYEYDENGNRTIEVTGGGVRLATYDGRDRLLDLGDVTYTYRPGGELASRAEGGGITRLDYDEYGNLLRAELPDGRVVEYLIDGRNRRIGRRIDGVLVEGLLYQDQLNPVALLDGAGQVVARFVYGTRANVPDYMVREGTSYRIVSDHLGSVRLVVDAGTGEVVQRLDYDAFGKVALDTSPGFQPFGFAGGLYDPDTGLVRFGVRDYDPSAGRWTTRDPILFAGRQTNLYGYVVNDPINLIDPDGRIAFGVVVGVAAAAAVAAIIALSRGRSPAEVARDGAVSGVSEAIPVLGPLVNPDSGFIEGLLAFCRMSERGEFRTGSAEERPRPPAPMGYWGFDEGTPAGGTAASRLIEDLQNDRWSGLK